MNLTIEKLVYGGAGLSRVDGQVVLTPLVLPGEQVRAEMERTSSGVQRARLQEVLRASSDRVGPPCPYFGRCGGCHYQHAEYAAQVEIKRGILAETLQHVGKIEPPAKIEAITGEPWGYRNRAQFHIRDRQLGYLEMGSHKLCAIEKCPISSPKINECIGILRKMLKDSRWPKFVTSIEIFTNESQVQLNVRETSQPVARRFFEWCAKEIPGMVPGALEYDGFRVGGESFFQVNRFLSAPLVEAAIGDAAGTSALDLYAGVGLFSVSLAKKFERVTAVESGTGAVQDCIVNARKAGAELNAVARSVDDYLRSLDSAPDFVLADPPRSGLGKIAVARLNELQPARMTIVSCDPSTLARDLAGLLAGGFHLDELTMVDLFPQTFHIEAIAKLSRTFT